MTTVVRPSRALLAQTGDCTTPDKICYRTEEAAQRFAVQIQQRYYHCACGMWHLTSGGVTSDYIDSIKEQIRVREQQAQEQEARSRQQVRISHEENKWLRWHEQAAARKYYAENKALASEIAANPRLKLKHGDRVYMPGWGYGRVCGFKRDQLRMPKVRWDKLVLAGAKDPRTNVNVNTKPLVRWPF